jgi:hypothetical protein
MRVLILQVCVGSYGYIPLISLLRPRRFLPLSIKASAMLRLNSIPVIKTSALLSPAR